MNYYNRGKGYRSPEPPRTKSLEQKPVNTEPVESTIRDNLVDFIALGVFLAVLMVASFYLSKR